MAYSSVFDPPADLCEKVKRMLDNHGDHLAAALTMLENTQFDRFSSTAPANTDDRENIYFSMLGAKEFHGFLHALAQQAPSNQTET